MVESSHSRKRRPSCKTNKEMTDEAADVASLTYLLTPALPTAVSSNRFRHGQGFREGYLNWTPGSDRTAGRPDCLWGGSYRRARGGMWGDLEGPLPCIARSGSGDIPDPQQTCL